MNSHEPSPGFSGTTKRPSKKLGTAIQVVKKNAASNSNLGYKKNIWETPSDFWIETNKIYQVEISSATDIMQRVFGVNPFPLGLITHPGIVEAWRYFFRLKKNAKNWE